MITFQLKGDKHVIKQVGTDVRLHQALQTNRHTLPIWSNAPKHKFTDVTRIKCERTKGDFDVVFKASSDVELQIDYTKDADYIGFYHHKNIRKIGLFEHDNGTFITEINIPKGSKRPITFSLSDLAYNITGDVYYQNFYEFWKKASDYAEDFNLSGLQMDAGDLTSTVTDHYDCNIQNVGVGLSQFNFN